MSQMQLLLSGLESPTQDGIPVTILSLSALSLTIFGGYVPVLHMVRGTAGVVSHLNVFPATAVCFHRTH